jgi:hypothetical protein
VIEGASHGRAPESPQFIKDVREFLERHPAIHRSADAQAVRRQRETSGETRNARHP